MGATVALAVDLAWDANPDRVAGYRVFYGPASRVYTNAVDTGTNLFLRGVPAVTRTFFSVAAYNSLGLESDFGAELVFTPIVFPLVIETSPDLRSWARLTNFVVFTSEEQAFFRLRVGQ